ncbi:MAG: TIGR03619 family F420-dependent LLM class oxidoreductase [Actinomycetota bacterium]|nr:TIGR03619 family F420-dependent LLM class oxidoreductase [Actinomycetota bacterium]
MRFTVMEPTALSPAELLHLAQVAEECGFDSFALNDGTFQMRDTRGVYPYSPDNKRNWDIEAPLFEPMTLLPALAMQTERIRLFTSVIKLPLHHPLVLAKQVATAAIMSNDRFMLGVGASWAPEEYEFCGIDWSRRGAIMTESLEVLRLVLSGEMVEYHGEVFDFAPLIARPAPRQPVRFLIGGHHEPSLQRAARLADGWIAAGPPSIDDLPPIIERLRQLCEEYGRDWSDFEIHAYPRDVHSLDDFRRLADVGVTDAITLPINTGEGIVMDESTRQRLSGQQVVAAVDPDRAYSTAVPQVKVDAVRRFADNIVSRFDH